MNNVNAFLIFSSVLLWVSNDAAAQTDRTGTGGGPLTTERAPNTTAVGQTKPPSRDASPTSVKRIDRLSPREITDDFVTARVCIGCTADPGTTGTTSAVIKIPAVQTKAVPELSALASAPAPRQQADLDTIALASAHRERAQSMEEKTNGLWQSWLVSVCDGCGDQLPAKPLRLEEWPTRDKLMPLRSSNRQTSLDERRAEVSHRRSFTEDLSTENIDTIRRKSSR